MKIIALDLNNLKTESIYKAQDFEVWADFKIDPSNKLTQIEITIKNVNTKYNYLSGNLCVKPINTNLDVHSIELHIMEDPNPVQGNFKITPKAGQNIILKNGTTLVTTSIIYKNQTNPPVRACHYPNYNSHPQTKDGAVVVSI